MVFRLAVVILAVATANPPACELDDNGPVGLPSTCVIKADYPHHSHHVAGRINGEAGVKCSESFPRATVNVRLERSTDSETWVVVNANRKAFAPLPANRRRTAQADTPCRDGNFRVTAWVTIADGQETYKSEEYHGGAVKNPCDE